MASKGVFPQPIKVIFQELWHEVCLLHANWKTYLELFGNPEVYPVLNDTVPSFFKLIGNSLRTDMVMGVGRLTDALALGKKDNLCFERLIHVLRDNCADKEFLDRVAAEKDAILAHCKPIKELRHRRIGHRDLSTALKYHPDPLPNIDRGHMQAALDMIAELMNEVEAYFENRTTAYAHPTLLGTGSDLLDYLRFVLEMNEKEKRRLLGGDKP
jgi:hypothetical protein